MSKFVIVPDYKFEVIYIAFDNSNNEMEYTKYSIKDKLNTKDENKHKLFAHLLDNGYQSLNNPDCLINIDIENVTVIIALPYANRIITYNYQEDDGGVYEIPDNSQDIYKSRFDDMHEAINSFIGTTVDKQFIYEIEE